jgi:DNA-binding MarR family transcriptional regulator
MMTIALRGRASHAQLAVLQALAHQSPTSLTGLVERLGVNRTWLSRTVRRLANEGYVSRTRSATDARRAELVITPRGRSLLELMVKERPR